MSSLQDQLLEAGLANQKQAKLASKAQKKRARDQRKGVATQTDVAKRITEEKNAQAERSKKFNAQRLEQQTAKELIAQVKQMVDGCRLSIEGGDIAYNFVDGTKVKRIYVTPEQHGLLSRGSIVIVGIAGHYNLVPAPVGVRVEERTDQVLVVKNDRQSQDNKDTEDDPYADFVIPDDLIW